MKRLRLWIVACLLAALAPAARAQYVPFQTDALDGMVNLAPLAGPDGAPLVPTMGASGTAGGRSATSVGNVTIGFDYLRPYWTSRDFTLAVPAASVGGFPFLGDIGHVDDHFALAPRMNYKYDVSDVFAISASGTFLNLTGQIQRQVTASDGGQGSLTANSSLTLITANFPEVGARVFYDEIFDKNGACFCSCLEDLVIDVGVGTRYSSIDQNYTGSLTNSVAGGSNVSTRYSHQAFKGVGITSNMNFSLPIRENWVVFTNLRGSMLIGDNSKDSTLTVTIAGAPGISSAINQTKTELIPVAEIEMGTEWGVELGERLRANLPPPLFTVRIALAGQFWGDVGPLSAGSPQGFRTSNLFLVGAHIMVGVHR